MAQRGVSGRAKTRGRRVGVWAGAQGRGIAGGGGGARGSGAGGGRLGGWVGGIFLRGVFWVLGDEVLLGGGRGRAWEGARETAKRAAGIDAEVMGRDALGWSGSSSLFFAGSVNGL